MRTNAHDQAPPQQEWDVSAAPSFAPPTFQLQTDSVLQRTEGDGCGIINVKWESFATGFNSHFTNALHAFEGKVAPTGTANDKVGGKSGEELSAEQLSCLFTVKQRDKLLTFFSTNEIPDRLFNGDDQGNLSGPQRIVLSGIILSNGTYKPGSFDQKVHARMCGHWVKITWHYAGVSAAGNSEWAGVSGSLDHDGNVMLGNGKHEGIYSGLGKNRTYAKDTEADKLGELLPEGTNHAKAYEEAGDDRKKKFHRNKAMPFEDLSKLKTGDWLYYYNGNGSASGDHSVIFSRWASEVQEENGIKFRTAIVFSQGTPKSGGKEHTVRLGDQFSNTTTKKICTVTKVSRVAEDAQPADSVADVIGKVSEGEAFNGTNKKYLKSFKKKFKGEMDLNQLRQSLRAENTTLIDHLAALEGDRLTAGQEALLRKANQEEHIENLVRLCQRLRALKTNVDLYDYNRKTAYETGKPEIKGKRKRVPGLNEKYDGQRTEAEAKLADLDQKILDIDNEMAPLQEEISTLEAELDGYTHGKRLKQIRNELNSTWTEVKKLKPRSEERSALMKYREKLQDEKKLLQKDAKGNTKESSALKKKLAPLKKKVQPLEGKRARYEKDKVKINKEDPYGLVHHGSNKKQDSTNKFSGNIEEVRSLKTSGGLVVREKKAD